MRRRLARGLNACSEMAVHRKTLQVPQIISDTPASVFAEPYGCRTDDKEEVVVVVPNSGLRRLFRALVPKLYVSSFALEVFCPLLTRFQSRLERHFEDRWLNFLAKIDFRLFGDQFEDLGLELHHEA